MLFNMMNSPDRGCRLVDNYFFFKCMFGNSVDDIEDAA